MAINENYYKCEYKELTNEETRIKKLIKKRFGYFNEEAIERIYDETKLLKDSIIDIIEGGDNEHDISEYIKLAIVLDTNIEYLVGLTEYDEPIKWNEEECMKII